MENEQLQQSIQVPQKCEFICINHNNGKILIDVSFGFIIFSIILVSILVGAIINKNH